jgi:hypothetical protein
VTVTRTVTHTVTAAATTPGPPAACAASALRATFKAVPGSAGAGNIVYALTVTNRSQAPCAVSGVPPLSLLDAKGDVLPSKQTVEPGSASTVVTLSPSASATVDARFSPDVPGVGETKSPCEPVATTVRVTIGDTGAVDAAVEPPTSVCSHGAMQLRPFTAGD